MNVRVLREPTQAETTLGTVLVNGRFFHFSLEDAIREVVGQPVDTWKVPGKTAITAGVYPLRMTWSVRFGKIMPEVMAVPGFFGIRVHPGNTPNDTEGCILMGVQRSGLMIRGAVQACQEFTALLVESEAKGETSTISMENPV